MCVCVCVCVYKYGGAYMCASAFTTCIMGTIIIIMLMLCMDS